MYLSWCVDVSVFVVVCECVCQGVWMCVCLSGCVHVSVFVILCGCECACLSVWM